VDSFVLPVFAGRWTALASIIPLVGACIYSMLQRRGRGVIGGTRWSERAIARMRWLLSWDPVRSAWEPSWPGTRAMTDGIKFPIVEFLNTPIWAGWALQTFVLLLFLPLVWGHPLRMSDSMSLNEVRWLWALHKLQFRLLLMLPWALGIDLGTMDPTTHLNHLEPVTVAVCWTWFRPTIRRGSFPFTLVFYTAVALIFWSACEIASMDAGLTADPSISDQIISVLVWGVMWGISFGIDFLFVGNSIIIGLVLPIISGIGSM